MSEEINNEYGADQIQILEGRVCFLKEALTLNVRGDGALTWDYVSWDVKSPTTGEHVL